MKRLSFIICQLSFSVALVAFAACSSSSDSDFTEPTPTQPANGKYTLTVNASKGDNAMTRALGLSNDGTTLNATWAEGEKVYVYKGEAAGEISIGTLVATNVNGASCTLTGDIELDNLNKNDKLYLQYKGSARSGYAPQDGTIATIANYYDRAYDVVTITEIGSSTVTTTDANFVNQQAIVKFTLQDNAGNAISPDKITVTQTVNNVASDITVAGTTYTSNGNCFYIAFSPNTTTVDITATVGNDTYTYSKSGAAFTAGQYYAITVKMSKLPELGDLYYSDGTYSSTLVSGKTPIGVIAYIDQSGTADDEITEKSNGGGHGLVLCLKNAASNLVWHTKREWVFSESVSVQNTAALKRYSDVSGYSLTSTLSASANASTAFPAACQAKNYSELTAPSGSTGWFLPSAQQWVRMMTGLGGLSEDAIVYGSKFDNSHSAIDLWDAAFAKAGSGNYDSMSQSSMYWTSSECDQTNAIRVVVDQSNSTGYGPSLYINGFVKDGNGSGYCRVRPVLAF